jgi:transcriptional regulator with XRE-family HTH domain
MCDRSRVSRALSGREVPPRDLIERIAAALGDDIGETRRRWDHADIVRRQARACRAGGGPPDGLDRYTDLLQALRDLLRGRGISQRQLVQRDQSGRLRRSTVGAVLRGERTAQRTVVIAIVRACGVSDTAAAAWATAWWRLGRPHQQEQHRRRREGYERRAYAEMMSGRWR